MDSGRQGGLLSPYGTGREQKGIVPVSEKACWGGGSLQRRTSESRNGAAVRGSGWASISA